MATQTRPFMMTGAALVSAAAIVGASPAIAPQLGLPTPAALSAAKYELTTFADLFTVPAQQWIASYFQGYGGLIGADADGNPNPYAPQCYNNCYASGVNGIGYLAADAFINGNGNGWNDASNWPVSAINYYYEGSQFGGGFTPFIQYVAQTTVGSQSQVLSTLLNLVFAGPTLVTQIVNTSLATVAALLDKLPLVGPYIAGGIYAFIGQNGYTPGLTGLVNYVLDVVANIIKPQPPTSAAAVAAAAAVASPAAALQSVVKRVLSPGKAESVAAPAVSVAAPTAAAAVASKPETDDAVTGTKTETHTDTDTHTSKTETTGSESSTKTETESESDTSSKPESSTSTDDANEAAETKSVDPKPVDPKPADPSSTPAASAVTAPAPAATKTAGKPAGKRAGAHKQPVRDAVQKAAKQIQAALSGAKAGASK